MTSSARTPIHSRSGARHRAREFCLALLFQADVAGMSPARVFQYADETLDILFEAWEVRGLERARLQADVEDFGRRLAQQYFIHAPTVDAIIEELSREWSLSRMPSADRNILRMAITELLHFPEVPVSAAINEAVDLAKQYGAEESGKFVNGILGAFARLRTLDGADTGTTAQ